MAGVNRAVVAERTLGLICLGVEVPYDGRGQRVGEGCIIVQNKQPEADVLLRVGPSKSLLGGVHHVQEAIFIPLALVDLGNGRGNGYHAVTVHQKEESLVGVQLQAPPDDLDEFAHVHVIRNQKLCFVQNGKLLLTLIPLNDHRDFVWVLLSDLSNIIHPLFKCPPLFERLF